MAVNNVGEATVDSVFQAVSKLVSPKMNDLDAQHVAISNSGGGVIKNNSGTKSLKPKQ